MVRLVAEPIGQAAPDGFRCPLRRFSFGYYEILFRVRSGKVGLEALGQSSVYTRPLCFRITAFVAPNTFGQWRKSLDSYALSTINSNRWYCSFCKHINLWFSKYFD